MIDHPFSGYSGHEWTQDEYEPDQSVSVYWTCLIDPCDWNARARRLKIIQWNDMQVGHEWKRLDISRTMRVSRESMRVKIVVGPGRI